MQSILMLVLLFGLCYFMLIRPENKRKKDADQLRNSLKKGDKITTIGGIVGTIVHVSDSTIVIETSEDRVRMEMTKWAVSTTGVQTNDQPASKKKEKKADAAEVPAVEAPAAEAPAPSEETAEPQEEK